MDDTPRSPVTVEEDADEGGEEEARRKWAERRAAISADADVDDPTGRLGDYLARTQNALDILALVTLWIVVVPVADFANENDLRNFGLSVRLILSVIYGIDMAIRSRLATHHWHYVRTHPLGLLAVIFPPVRVLFSLRLIRQLFRRGNLSRFLLAALFLLLNGAMIVFLFERDTPGANITTLGSSVWWSVVTVTTVGYGDYYPITVQGRVVACFIMFIGIVTVAVITAQVASSFVDQNARRAAAAGTEDALRTSAAAASAEASIAPSGALAAESVPNATVEPAAAAGAGATTIADLEVRLARIEELLVSLQPPTPGATDRS